MEVFTVDTIGSLVGSINSIVWGAPMLILIVGVGLFLMLRLTLMPLRKLGYGFKLLWGGRVPDGVGDNSIKIYRFIYIAVIFVGPLALTMEGGARAGIDLIWLVADTLNAMMALPNLIALALLSPLVIKLTRNYYASGRTPA